MEAPLAVEVLSPTDKQEEIIEKIESYLEAGVRFLWLAEARFRTITVHRPDAPPQLFNEAQFIDAEPHLPGFRVAVSEFFAR
jgi:Uma2 family endonuclease